MGRVHAACHVMSGAYTMHISAVPDLKSSLCMLCIIHSHCCFFLWVFVDHAPTWLLEYWPHPMLPAACLHDCLQRACPLVDRLIEFTMLHHADHADSC